MTDRQSIWYHMILTVITFLDSVAESIAKPAVILLTLGSIKENLKSIEELQSGEGKSTSGKTKKKAGLRKDLEAVIFNLSSSLHSYAIYQKIPDLIEMTDINESGFSSMREDKLYSEAIEINKLAEANNASLADYEITEEDITAHKALAEEFKAAIGDTGSSRKLSKEETAKLESLYSETLGMLDQLDSHINTLKLKKPEIAAGYFASRKLVNTGIRHNNNDENNPPDSPPAV